MAEPADSDTQKVGIKDQFTLCAQTIANIEKFGIDLYRISVPVFTSYTLCLREAGSL